MVVLNKIYTRGGDGGTTALGDGERVSKNSARVEAYGTVDETNSAVGLARLHAASAMDRRLAAIQNDLFDLGADLCRPLREGERASASTNYRVAGLAPGIRNRRHEREAAAPEKLRSSRWLRSVGRPTPLPNGFQASRAPDGRARECGGCQQVGADLPQPPVGLVFRSRALRQRRRGDRCAMEAGSEQVGACAGSFRHNRQIFLSAVTLDAALPKPQARPRP